MKITQIAMVSTHGYFDPVPRLGRTDTGGQVVYVLELSKSLSRQGIRVDIFTRWFERSKKQIDPVPGYPGVRIIRIPAGGWKFIPKEQIYDVLQELSSNMIRFICSNDLDYDLYHGHYVDGGIVTVEVARYFKKPSYFTPHSLGAWKREQMAGNQEEMERKFRFNHRIKEELRIFKSVNGLAVTSVVQLEKIDELYNLKPDNVANLPPGTNIDLFRPLKPDEKKQKIDLPKPYIYTLSRIDSNKGHDLLLNAFNIVTSKIENIHLVIGGGSTNPQKREREVLKNIEKIIEEKGLKDRVHLIGYVPDELVLPYYQNAELFVLPSIFEPFGMTASEAMACATPVIASKFGGIKNVIVSGENGILVDPTNPEEFSDSIIVLLRDRKLAKRLGQRGCETIRKEYSWEAIAQKHMLFYNKYINKKTCGVL